MEAKDGHKVKVHYTGTFDDGTVFDSSKDKDPLEFVVGSGQVVKGFDMAVKGMKKDETKTISIEPKDAYGDKNDQLVQDVPKTAFGENTPEIGQTIGLQAPTGQVLPATIKEINGDMVKLDMNHPLAGKKLNFEIKLVESRELTDDEKKEMEDSHEHGCGDDHCGGGCC